VDSLEKAALEAGAIIVKGAKVEKIEGHLLTLADGSQYQAEQIIIAATPHSSAEILNSPELKAAAEYSQPIRAACLNVALKRLPKPSNTFGLGIDQPLYYSVHSAVAKLAPEGGAVIHLAKYLAVGEKSDPTKDRAELENMLELFQPGWRDELVEARFMPNLTVYNAVVTAERGGLAGRTPVSLPGYDNIYLVGDWVGSEGILSDATFASARLAAQANLSKNPARQEAITGGR
jgi:phytoene dehydrogenase-like protein